MRMELFGCGFIPCVKIQIISLAANWCNNSAFLACLLNSLTHVGWSFLYSINEIFLLDDFIKNLELKKSQIVSTECDCSQFSLGSAVESLDEWSFTKNKILCCVSVDSPERLARGSTVSFRSINDQCCACISRKSAELTEEVSRGDSSSIRMNGRNDNGSNRSPIGSLLLYLSQDLVQYLAFIPFMLREIKQGPLKSRNFSFPSEVIVNKRCFNPMIAASKAHSQVLCSWVIVQFPLSNGCHYGFLNSLTASRKSDLWQMRRSQGFKDCGDQVKVVLSYDLIGGEVGIHDGWVKLLRISCLKCYIYLFTLIIASWL